MDTSMVIGILVAVVVAFFAYQWYTAAAHRPAKKTVPAPAAAIATAAGIAASPLSTKAPKEENYPEVAGQTEAEMRAKEPVQRQPTAAPQEPVTHEGHGPAQFEDNLRHPERAFHQPADVAPTLTVSDVPSGRAAADSTPQGGHQQPFSPEMAQNGGALIGNSVFAFDGMEPTTFSAF
jgi:hypothetical protein